MRCGGFVVSDERRGCGYSGFETKSVGGITLAGPINILGRASAVFLSDVNMNMGL